MTGSTQHPEKMVNPSFRYVSVCFLIGILSIPSLIHATSSLQLSPDSDMSYEEEYERFMADKQDHDHLSRQKRFVYLNVDTNMAVALLVGVPLTFVLPSMSNVFNSWRRKRSVVGDLTQLEYPGPGNPEMEKVATYFQLLEIPEASCQLRAVCEFSADPYKYYPLAEVILKRIRNPSLPSLAYSDSGNDLFTGNSSYLVQEGIPRSTKKSLYELYNQAADEGQVYGAEKCDELFSKSCHYPIDKLLNMPVIKFWSAINALLKISFKDVAFK